VLPFESKVTCSPTGCREPTPALPANRCGSNSKDFAMSFLQEFFRYISHRKKYWLLPVFAMMLVFGGMLILTKGSALAPFIYTLF
jgi:hypothetical protein